MEPATGNGILPATRRRKRGTDQPRGDAIRRRTDDSAGQVPAGSGGGGRSPVGDAASGDPGNGEVAAVVSIRDGRPAGDGETRRPGSNGQPSEPERGNRSEPGGNSGKGGARGPVKSELDQQNRTEAKTSLEKIFRGFATVRQEKDASEAFRVMQEELCNELPHLISLGQITLKDGIALLGTLEEKIKAGDDGSSGSAEEGFRQFLTQGEAEPHHKATPAQSKGSPKVQ